MTRSPDIPVAATGLLADFARAGAIGWSGVHLANTLGWLGGETRPQVLLAAALCLRAQEAGSVCVPLDDVATGIFALEPDDSLDQEEFDAAPPAWPEVDEWLAMLADSPLVSTATTGAVNQRPLRLVGRKLYLERNWQDEEDVRLSLHERLATTPPGVDSTALNHALDKAFARFSGAGTDQQRAAVATSASSWTSVIAGGPGTGKTTTIAQLLRVLDDLADRRTSVALAAFTGKAAARMQQSLESSLAEQASPEWRWLQVAPATTLHSLLKSRPDHGFGRDRANPLPHDVLIVDEMSMVSLSLMSALLAAMRPSTRLIMVGDPHQLSSVDAGAVLADIVTAGLPIAAGRTASAITILDHSHRFSGPIRQLASAIRLGDADQALQLLAAGHDEVQWVNLDPEPRNLLQTPGLADDVIGQGRALHAASRAGDATAAVDLLDQHRLLCAHRRGRYGVAGWSRAVEQTLRGVIDGYGREGDWYAGRPLLITRNSPELQISNGDTGVVVSAGQAAQVALATGGPARLISPWLLDSVDTMHALTIHKSQGSEYGVVTVILPTNSALLSRELLYTAVTRAKQRVRLVGTAEAIALAIRTPATRATGLGERLRLP